MLEDIGGMTVTDRMARIEFLCDRAKGGNITIEQLQELSDLLNMVRVEFEAVKRIVGEVFNVYRETLGAFLKQMGIDVDNNMFPG